MSLFADLGLTESILRAITAEGYTDPTPIQSAAIPAILADRDVIGIAQTGTGKTAAFVWPLLQKLSQDRQRAEPKRCRALILAPTRELAQQIADSVRTYGRFMRPSVAVIIGGAGMTAQSRALMQGTEIVVATPGRLLDHMTQRTLSLESTRYVVLDEADQMLDLGFMPAIRRIMKALPHDRQTVMFSATMPGPLRSLAQDFLHTPQEVAVAAVSKPVERIAQSVLLVEQRLKAGVLVDILNDATVTRAIVFTRTKRGADKVTAHLDASGISAAAIHGNKSQGQRERALGAFRRDEVKVLVATDIAARGIDVDGVSHVVNFELPNVPEAYVHRIGRTARAGAEGRAISLCDAAERPLLRDIEKLTGLSLLPRGAAPQRGVHQHPHGVPGGAEGGRDPFRAARPRPQRPAADRHGPDRHDPDRHSSSERHAADRPLAERKPIERPHHERPHHERPHHDRPHHDRPHLDRPAAERHGAAMRHGPSRGGQVVAQSSGGQVGQPMRAAASGGKDGADVPRRPAQRRRSRPAPAA